MSDRGQLRSTFAQHCRARDRPCLTPEPGPATVACNVKRLLASVTVAAACATSWCATAGAQQLLPDAPLLFPPESVGLELGRPYTGTLHSAGEQAIGRIDATAEFSLVQLRITHTNETCDVWARLVDFDGTTLGRAYVVGARENTVTGLAAAAGPIFVVIDNGPIAHCSGAAYRLVASTSGFQAATPPPTPAQSAVESAAPSSPVLCYAWSKRAEQLGIKLRRTQEVLPRSSHRQASRLRKKLASVSRQYSVAHGFVLKYC